MPVMEPSSNNTMEVSTASTGDPHIKSLESLTKGILAFVVIIALIQLAILALLFPLLRNKRTTQAGDLERGIELQNRPSNSHNSGPQVQEHEYAEPSWGGHANGYYAGYAQDGWTVQPLRVPSPPNQTKPDKPAQSRWRRQRPEVRLASRSTVRTPLE